MPKATKPSLTIADLLADYPPAVQALTAELRHLIHSTVPVATEAVYPGWQAIGYTHPTCGYFCALFPQASGVNLALEFGVLLPDPEELLQGDGKQCATSSSPAAPICVPLRSTTSYLLRWIYRLVAPPTWR